MNTGIQELFKEKMKQQFRELQQTNSSVRISHEAFEKFLQNGVPNTKNEEWKYTNLEPALKFDYHITGAATISSDFIQSLFPAIECHKLVFVNGVYNDSLSSVLNEDALHIVHIKQIEDLKSLSNNASVMLPDNGWTYLNEAIIREGISIRASKNKQSSCPIILIHLSSNSAEASIAQYRHLIHLEENAGLTIIEAHVALNASGVSLSNVNTQIQLDRNAHLTHIKLQDVNNGGSINHLINYTSVWQDEYSNSKQYTFSLSGELIRNNLHIQLAGKNSEAHLYGLYTPHQKEIIDNHTLVDHAVSHCHSNELYKGIASDSSKAVFNGKILVRKDAQKTNAFQSNKNLVLTREAAVYTKPQLEIFADDVKCSHGATSGQLDEEALFYLKARGISESEARKMLMLAFAEDITATIEQEWLQTWLNQFIEHKLS